jgi:2,4-dienoyl-CoA reductase-like NADH-dependent reductase (Old Yellow Enzyme family)
MANPAVAGGRALAPSARFNLYGPVWPRAMDATDIARVVASFGRAVRLAADAGFDAVEVHAGHGYLVSQFLSPRTNRRRDAYGGPLANRMRFMREVMAEVKRAASGRLAVVVKTNLRDGFPGGNGLEEGLEIARALEEEGADALVLSGGFVSRAPMAVMRGPMPMAEMSRRMKPWWFKAFVRAFGGWLVPEVPYQDHYFLEDATVVRRALRLPLVYVGGVASRSDADAVLARGFDAIALARALIREPDFVERLRREGAGGGGSRCDHCNVCAARIYTTSMACHHWPGVS